MSAPASGAPRQNPSLDPSPHRAACPAPKKPLRALAARIALASLVALLFALTACKQTPDLAAGHLRRGDAALAQGDYAQALAAYGHARELAPTDQNVQRSMMIARAHLIAESAARLSPEAIEDARYEAALLLEEDPARSAVYFTAQANILARQGDIEGAKGKIGRALAADPESPLAHAALGLLLMTRREDINLAQAQLEHALKSRPNDLRALVALGQIELSRGDVARALGHLESALRVAEDFEARMALGDALSRQQKPADALVHFRRAAALDPKSPAALAALGQTLLTLGKPEEAEPALRASVQLQPGVESEVALGYALLRQKKTSSALIVFERILAEDPAVPAALHGAGSASEDLGRREPAIEYYRRLLALPSGGPQPQVLADLQRSAATRLAALTTAAASGSASAGPAPPRPTK